MTVTMTMTIPLRASRANLDLSIRLSDAYPLAHPHPHSYPHPPYAVCHARVLLVRPLGHLFQLLVFLPGFVLWFPKLWSACRIIAHNGQTTAHRPLIFFLVYFFLGPFVSLLPGILAHPRVHRPPTTQISGGVQGPWSLGMGGSGSTNTHTHTTEPGWLANELCPGWDLG